MRILVTGSRTWHDKFTIGAALIAYEERKPILVSGHCPKGADKIAEDWATFLKWKIETHPANWNRHGRRAGFIRNQEMVDLGADICLAFIFDKSSGATHTAKAAEKAGIPTVRYEQETRTSPTPADSYDRRIGL